MLRGIAYTAVLGLLMSALGSVQAFAEHGVKESHVKAAILFNLIRFSEWPQSETNRSDTSFTLCTQTTNGMKAALGDLAGKHIHERSLNVTHLNGDSPNYSDCDALFLSEDANPEPLDLNTMHEMGILTIGDSPKLLKSGTCMSIQRQGKKVRFSINRDAIESANIKPSSKILNLAMTPE